MSEERRPLRWDEGRGKSIICEAQVTREKSFSCDMRQRNCYWRTNNVNLGNGETQYNVTFRSMFGLALVLSIFAFSFIGYAIFCKKPLLVIPGFLLFALLVVIRIRFKVTVDEWQIEYTGFFATKVILFSDIVHSGWMFEHGYSKDRFYGSFVYEILSKNTCIRINFRLFPLGPMSKVIELMENLPEKHIKDNRIDDDVVDVS